MILAFFSLTACSTAVRDRSIVWTEAGLEAAELQWHEAYHERLKYCRNTYAPKTMGAEKCFGDWYDNDRRVEIAVRKAVALLRTYWTARAAGESDPSWEETLEQVAAIVGDLPPPARQYFERIKGLP